MITVTLNAKNELVLDAHFSYKDRIKALKGAYFDWDEKKWKISRNGLDNLLARFRGELFFKTPIWVIRGEERPKRAPIEYVSESVKNLTLPTLNLKPYNYQEEGIRFLIDRLENLGFALLADDVGLGKTIQSIAAMMHFRSFDPKKKVIIICKKSIKYQWAEELKNVTGLDLPVFVTGKTKKKRLEAYENAKNTDGAILVTNYHNFLNDSEEIEDIGFFLSIIDEVHCIKGRKGKMNNLIGNTARRTKTIFLTGTPIMSRPDDIFGIVQIAKPDYFGKYSEFAKDYIVAEIGIYGYQIIGAKNLHILSRRLKNFMLRRSNDDVNLDLPEITLTKLKAELDPVQEAMIEVVDKNLLALRDERAHFLDETGKPNSLYLKEFQDLVDKEKMYLASKQFIADDPRCFELVGDTHLNAALRKKLPQGYTMSSKTELTIDLVEDIVEAGNKVIIFTHFESPARMLKDDIEKSLKKKVLMFTGKVDDEERVENLRLFKESDKYNILIGNEACAEGLNLQFASYLINYEQADTYAQKQQRIGRIRRIGSKSSHAHVYDVITKGSYDENRLAKMERDKALSESLVN